MCPRGSPSLERIRPREGERAGSSCEAAFSTIRVHVLQSIRRAKPLLVWSRSRRTHESFNHRPRRRAGGWPGSRSAGRLSSRAVRELARRSLWAAKRICSVSAAGCWRFFGPPTQSTRWAIIARGLLRAPFAVWRRSSGRMPSAITLATSGRCGRPQRTSQTCEGTGIREPAVTGRAADAGERHRAGPAILSRPPPTTPSARRCIWTRPLWPVHRWDGPNASSTSRRPSLTV